MAAIAASKRSAARKRFDKRSNTVTLLGKLATVVVRAGEPLWFTGDTRDLAPQIEEAVEAYVDESHSQNNRRASLGQAAR